jgi:hypothetical protein
MVTPIRFVFRRFQFGLRTLFVAILLVAVGMTLWMHYIAPFKRQREGLSVLEEFGFSVSTRAADGSDWQKWLVGEDDFVQVTSVRFGDQIAQVKLQASGVRPKPLDDRIVDALSRLRSVEHLNLCWLHVTDKQLQKIATIPHIEVLYLRGNPIGDEGVKSLVKYEGLKRLCLNRTLVSDASLEIVGQFELLEDFSLSSPNVKGPGLIHLAKLRNLTDLQFTGPNVTNEWVAAVASLPNLHWVELHSTSVDERAMVHIRRWKNLRSLYLNQNAINVDAIGDLRTHLPKLQKLEVHGNRPRSEIKAQ